MARRRYRHRQRRAVHRAQHTRLQHHHRPGVDRHGGEAAPSRPARAGSTEPARVAVPAPRRWRGRLRDLAAAGSVHSRHKHRLLVPIDLHGRDRPERPVRNAGLTHRARRGATVGAARVSRAVAAASPGGRAVGQLRHGVQRHRHRAYSPGSAERDAGAGRLQPLLHAALRQRRDGGPPLRDLVFW